MMTRLLLTMLVACMLLFSSPVLAEQFLGRVVYFDKATGFDLTVGNWLVDSKFCVSTDIDQRKAAKLHRDALNTTLEQILDSSMSQSEKDEFALSYGEQIGATAKNQYHLFCQSFEPNHLLEPLLGN